jgi:hypothetical protein
LTRFLCQELLYEYVSGTLDPSRRRDMDDYLAECRDSQRELLNLKKGLQFAEELSRVRVSADLQEALLNFEPPWKRRLQAWTLWSSRRGWRMLPYAFIFVTAVLTLAVWKPWRPNRVREVILAEQDHHVARPALLAPAATVGPQAPPRPTEPQPTAEPPARSAAPDAATAAPSTATTTTAAHEAPAVIKPPTPPTQATTPVAASKDEEVRDNDQKHENMRATAKGSLLRGELVVEDFDSSWPAIREKIVSLGGKAAGTVELGWLRRKDQSYFHFSLPESNYAELEEFLKTFGPVQIHKEPHPRVMPAGQIRIILTVKDGDTDEGEAEAP